MASEEIKITAYVILVVEAGKEYEVLRKLLEMNAVGEAHIVYGEYDIIARLEVADLAELEKTVMFIRRIPGVERSITLISA
ncbi:MAG: Lrp/AsnC ligand binding domain-containing protein [Thermofilaceae archaeon]